MEVWQNQSIYPFSGWGSWNPDKVRRGNGKNQGWWGLNSVTWRMSGGWQHKENRGPVGGNVWEHISVRRGELVTFKAAQRQKGGTVGGWASASNTGGWKPVKRGEEWWAWWPSRALPNPGFLMCFKATSQSSSGWVIQLIRVLSWY